MVSFAGRFYKYDAFGDELTTKANDGNPFRYAGEYFDEETGSYYLRARYYDPATGRFGAEDPIRDGLNFYTYCYGNPVSFVDSNGLTPYTIPWSASSPHYTLFVTPQWLENFDTSAGMGLGAIEGWAGMLYDGLMAAADEFLLGQREIGYEFGDDFLGYASGFMEMSGNPITKDFGNSIGKMQNLKAAFEMGTEQFAPSTSMIEEAIFNQFDGDTWISHTREMVELKFLYAYMQMNINLLAGNVKIMKAGDYFGSEIFSNDGRLGMIAYKLDMLTGKKRYYSMDDYYFFLMNEDMMNYILDMESILKSEMFQSY